MRCADWAALQGAQQIGTAPVVNGVLMIEWDGRWPRDASDVAELVEVNRAAKLQKIRVQLVRRDVKRSRKIVGLYRRVPDVPFRRMQHIEVEASHEALPSIATELLREPLTVGDDGDGIADILICAHGTRDACCGSSGTRVAQAVAASLDVPGVRVWRTSHLGGHRFAPTVLILPAGTFWGQVDSRTLPAIVRRELPPVAAARLLRGTTALDPALQVLEGAAFEASGWQWFERARHGLVDGDSAVLHGHSSLGDVSTWTGTVRTTRLIATPTCGDDAAAGGKFENELGLVSAAELVE